MLNVVEVMLDRRSAETAAKKFPAPRRYSEENVAFLSAVEEWKTSIRQSSAARQRSPEFARERFNRALRIYTDFVSPYHAQAQINIASQDLKRLEAVFADAARTLHGLRSEPFFDPVVPFATVDCDTEPSASASASSSLSSAPSSHDGCSDDEAISDLVEYWGDIPPAFDADVFNDAESSIKYLVLTNSRTGRVKERRFRPLGAEPFGSKTGLDRSSSKRSRVVRYLRAIKTGHARV